MEKKLKQGPQRGHVRPFGVFHLAVLFHLLCRSIFLLAKNLVDCCFFTTFAAENQEDMKRTSHRALVSHKFMNIKEIDHFQS